MVRGEILESAQTAGDKGWVVLFGLKKLQVPPSWEDSYISRLGCKGPSPRRIRLTWWFWGCRLNGSSGHCICLSVLFELIDIQTCCMLRWHISKASQTAAPRRKKRRKWSKYTESSVVVITNDHRLSVEASICFQSPTVQPALWARNRPTVNLQVS